MLCQGNCSAKAGIWNYIISNTSNTSFSHSSALVLIFCVLHLNYYLYMNSTCSRIILGCIGQVLDNMTVGVKTAWLHAHFNSHCSGPVKKMKENYLKINKSYLQLKGGFSSQEYIFVIFLTQNHRCLCLLM